MLRRQLLTSASFLPFLGFKSEAAEPEVTETPFLDLYLERKFINGNKDVILPRVYFSSSAYIKTEKPEKLIEGYYLWMCTYETKGKTKKEIILKQEEDAFRVIIAAGVDRGVLNESEAVAVKRHVRTNNYYSSLIDFTHLITPERISWMKSEQGMGLKFNGCHLFVSTSTSFFQIGYEKRFEKTLTGYRSEVSIACLDNRAITLSLF